MPQCTGYSMIKQSPPLDILQGTSSLAAPVNECAWGGLGDERPCVEADGTVADLGTRWGEVS